VTPQTVLLSTAKVAWHASTCHAYPALLLHFMTTLQSAEDRTAASQAVSMQLLTYDQPPSPVAHKAVSTYLYD